MIKHYLRTGFRNLLKNKVSTLINIFGLTVGMTSCFLIILYIKNEAGYDSFQLNRDRIVRVIMEYKFDGGEQSNKGNFTSVRVASVMKRNFPEVESAVKLSMREMVVKAGEKMLSEKRILFADSSFFQIFTFQLLEGDPSKVLGYSHNVILTRSTAKKYFGDLSPMGKSLHIGNDSIFYQVAGLMEDCPSNSQIKFDFLIPFTALGIGREYEESYWDANYTTYLLLRDKPAISTLQAKLPGFMKKEMAGQGATVNFSLEPFASIHLYSEYGGFEPNNSIVYLKILGAVALLILFIVGSTYVNLSTARSIERAKEVGVRKAIGAKMDQLFWQFMGETGLLCLLAFVVSLLAAVLLLPYFNQLTDKQLHAGALFAPGFLGLSLLLTFCLGLLSGMYPALLLARFQPITVLKGNFRNSSSGQWIRKSLLLFQFAVSVFLVVSALVMQKQLDYIQHKDLGYVREQVLVMPIDGKMSAVIAVLKKEFKSDPNILSVSSCVSSPVNIPGGYNMRSAAMPENQQIAVTGNPVDEDYVRTTGLQIISGTDFKEQDVKDVSSDTQGQAFYHFLLNESAAGQLGWTASQAVGKKMFLDASRPGIVSGVVKDFHFESLHHAIRPLVLFPEKTGRLLLLKLGNGNLEQTLSFLQAKWKTLVSQRPFEYRFLDDDFNRLYNGEQRLGKLMNLFSLIAIILACLGLFGLSSFTIQQRVKEVGVRKVLGANSINIVTVLSRGFLELGLVSLLIAFPIAWWVMHQWLEGFSYRTNIGVAAFLIAAVLVLSLSMVTVGFHTIRASMVNPVKSLRTE